jgi:peptidyl-tRNA hydrolase, PTH1 family
LLGTQEYARLRFGVGDDFPRGQQVKYVLSNFPEKEFEELLIDLDRAGDAILSFCTLGLQNAMNNFNQ